MKEKLYTVPVNDAFDAQSECPVCTLYRDLERRAVEFVLGPSYMEDDVRAVTNELGFCGTHLDMLLREKNRLGLAMILKTHLDRQLQENEKFTKAKIKPKNLLRNDTSDFTGWAKTKENTCYICGKIGALYPHYIETIVYLYKKETKKFNFVSLFMHIDIKLHHQMNHFHTNSLYETLFSSWIHTTNRI